MKAFLSPVMESSLASGAGELLAQSKGFDELSWPSPANTNAPFMSVRWPAATWYFEHGKRVLDLTLIAILGPLALALVLIAAVALWLDGGQPFYLQKRLGRNGRSFLMWKLRSMAPDADARLESCLRKDPALRAEWDRTQKLKNDPRVTRIGAFLRATSMDELPQLWNVLKGDMSLVGPRPMMPDQLDIYGDATAYFAVRPGITGPWQVGGRNQVAFARRAVLDIRYLAEVSLFGDLVLLFRTIGVVVRRTGC